MNALINYKRTLIIGLALCAFAPHAAAQANYEITEESVARVDEQLLKLLSDLIFNTSDNQPFHVYADKAVSLLQENRILFIEILSENGIDNPEAYLDSLIARLEEMKYTKDYNGIVAELKKWAFLAPAKTRSFIEQNRYGVQLVKMGLGLKQRLNIANNTNFAV